MRTILNWSGTNRRVAAGLLVFAVYAGGGDSARAVSVNNFVARSYTNAQGVLPYRLFIPTNYASCTSYPLVLFLHGAGERGSDNRLQLTGQTGPLVFASETNQLRNPSFMVAPQCPTSGSWSDSVRRGQVYGLMNALQAEFRIDTNRCYITGLSMGGNGTWDQISQYPNLYAAAIPMNGWGDVSLAGRLSQIPIWNFHAANDSVVNVSNSRQMIEAVRKNGGNAIYTEYTSGGHGIWTPAYNTPILMAWVYSQRRGSASTAPPLLTIRTPTDLPAYACPEARLDLSGTASDGATGPTLVTWTNYRALTVSGTGTAAGTTSWAITNVALTTNYTNTVLVTGRGSSWYPGFGGYSTFNDTLKVIFPPFIVVQPQPQPANEGDAVTFNVAVNASAPSPRYQWRFNGTDITGASGSSLALTKVQVSDAGLYSVRITNQFGAVLSSNVLLSVNRIPVAQCADVIVRAGGNCLAEASVDSGSYDPDGDPLTISQWPAGPYPLGTNRVLLTVIDSQGASNACNASVIVLDRTPPVIVCPADLVVTNAHDQWDTTVTFSPAVSDNCSGAGLPFCSPPSGSAFGVGRHVVTCAATDLAGNSSQCTFRITVWPGNSPPVPIIQVSPLAPFPGCTNLVVIAADNTKAALEFDAAGSYDVDDAHFNYFWYEGTNLFSTNVAVTAELRAGTHEITLLLDDTFPLGASSTNVTVEVISPAQAVGIIIELLEQAKLARRSQQPLLATLTAAAASFERGQTRPGGNQLRAFQNKVQAQVAPSTPAAAEDLMSAAQVLIDALGDN